MSLLPSDPESRLIRARLSLEGLSIGDAFGQRFFVHPSAVEALIADRAEPPTSSPWSYTDDTAMAVTVVAALEERGTIEANRLAKEFAQVYAVEPDRGYGPGARRALEAIVSGNEPEVVATTLFGGQGSKGNGGAMRSAPVGAYFADDIERAAEEAAESARATHRHPEGVAGAVAVAVGAAVAARLGERPPPFDGRAFLAEVAEHTPEGAIQEGIAKAVRIPFERSGREGARVLGSGQRVLASDTVPYSLWCAARHLDDFEEALWTTVAGLGDRDTTCAIVGGIVALTVGEHGLVKRWREAREPLP